MRPLMLGLAVVTAVFWALAVLWQALMLVELPFALGPYVWVGLFPLFFLAIILSSDARAHGTPRKGNEFIGAPRWMKTFFAVNFGWAVFAFGLTGRSWGRLKSSDPHSDFAVAAGLAMFYAGAAVIDYATYVRRRDGYNFFCPNGHLCEIREDTCPICGEPITLRPRPRPVAHH